MRPNPVITVKAGQLHVSVSERVKMTLDRYTHQPLDPKHCLDFPAVNIKLKPLLLTDPNQQHSFASPVFEGRLTFSRQKKYIIRCYPKGFVLGQTLTAANKER